MVWFPMFPRGFCTRIETRRKPDYRWFVCDAEGGTIFSRNSGVGMRAGHRNID